MRARPARRLCAALDGLGQGLVNANSEQTANNSTRAPLHRDRRMGTAIDNQSASKLVGTSPPLDVSQLPKMAGTDTVF